MNLTKITNSLRFAPSLVARVVQLIFGFFMTFFLANQLAPEDLGLYYILVAIAVACHFIFLNGLHFPIQRLLPDTDDERRVFLSSIFLVSFGVTTSALLIADLLAEAYVGTLPYYVLGIYCVSFAFSETLFSQVTNVTSAFRRTGLYCLSVLLRSAAILGFFWLYSGELFSTDIAMTCYILGNVLGSLPVLLLYSRHLRIKSASRHQLGDLVKFSFPFSISESFNQAAMRGDRILVGMFLGTSAAGEYSLSVDLARRVMTGLCINARLVYVRDAVDSYTSQDSERLKKSLHRMMASVLVLGISTSVSMSLFGADLLTPFLPANIIEASSRLLLIVPFAFTAEVLNTYVLLLPFELTKKRWLNTQVAIFKFAVFLPIFMVLINSYGVWGAAVAQCITLSLTMLFTLYMSQKHTPIRQSLLLPILSFTWSIVFVLIIKSTLDIWDDWSLNLLFATACTAGIFAVMIQTLLAFVLAKKAPEIKLNGETN